METGIITAAVGTLLSFTPYVFDDHAIDVYDRQMDYKKKIYTPIKTTSFSYDPKTKTMTPIGRTQMVFLKSALVVLMLVNARGALGLG